MTEQIKQLIPLLDKQIQKEDVSPEAGFIDGFVYDINRPSLTKCVFLLYSTDLSNVLARLREYKFRNLTTIRSKRIIYSNKKPYMVYAFELIDSDAKRLHAGLRGVSEGLISNFVKFWGKLDKKDERYFVGLDNLEVDLRSVPEEDYREPYNPFKTKKPGLCLESGL